MPNLECHPSVLHDRYQYLTRTLSHHLVLHQVKRVRRDRFPVVPNCILDLCTKLEEHSGE